MVSRQTHFLWWKTSREEFAAGLTLARECQHPDALLLASLFVSGPPVTPNEARTVFLSHIQDDPRALCWAALMMTDRDGSDDGRVLLTRSAEKSYAWAQAILGNTINYKDDFRLLESAAAQGDATGMAYWSNRLMRQLNPE